MENASRALIMAGSVLIALMIIGALMLMFGNLTSYQGTDTESTRTAQIAEFNQQFETYDRNNVRGSDLYSLLNKVIDYNRRQSWEGIGESGEEIRYEPMEITFTVNPISELSADGNNRLFTQNQYTVSQNTNAFENSIKQTIDDLEDAYGQSSLTNLTTGMSKIFTDSGDPAVIVANFNAASTIVKIDSVDDLKNKSKSPTKKHQDTKTTIQEDVYKYYEYIQFKRAHFDCTDIEYDGNTGRVTRMVFNFNGRFN